MKYTALVPVKSLSEAKTRLSTYLTPAQRATLMLEMLHHVLNTLQESQLFSQITVVSPDPHVLERVQTWGCHPLQEEQAGHNPALTAAAYHEIQEGATALLTISADLPLLRTKDLCGMLNLAPHHPIILAPSQDATGTNAILMRPPLIIPYVFGIHSLQKYQQKAQEKNVGHALYRSMGLAHDIDTIEDLEMLQDIEVRQHYTIQSNLCCV